MIRGCIIDIDGTLYARDQVIAGAATAIRRLRSAGIPFVLATNTTRRPRQELCRQLHSMDISVAIDDIHTAPTAAAAWLRNHGAQRVSLLLAEATFEEFSDFEFDDQTPDHVVVGDLGASWTFERLNTAFRALQNGATLVAIQKNRWWDDGRGPLLDAGPFVAALEYASGQSATVVGKPSPAFFATAAARLGGDPSQIAAIGDNIENDVWGAHDAGLLGIAVRTGSFDPQLIAQRARPPEAVLDSIRDLPAFLQIPSS